MADGPYSRVYWSILSDPEFEEIRTNPAALGSWLLLLIQADALWPSPALIPVQIGRRMIKILTAAGLIVVASGHRYVIKGMTEERTKRSDQARKSASARWSRNANAMRSQSASNAIAMLDETRRDETSTDARARARENPAAGDSEAAAEPEGEALSWLARHGCYVRPGNGYHQKLVLAVERHGANAIVGMLDRLAEAGVHDGDIKGFLFGAIDALDARTRPKTADVERAERADEQRAAHDRGVAATQEYIKRLQDVGR